MTYVALPLSGPNFIYCHLAELPLCHTHATNLRGQIVLQETKLFL